MVSVPCTTLFAPAGLPYLSRFKVLLINPWYHMSLFFSDNFFDSYLIVPCFHSFLGYKWTNLKSMVSVPCTTLFAPAGLPYLSRFKVLLINPWYHMSLFFSDNFFDSYLIVPCFHSFIGRCVDFYFISVFWFWSLFIFFISFLFYMNKQCARTGDRFAMLCTLIQTNYTCAIIITLIWRCLCTFFFSVIFLLFQCFHFSFSWLPGYVLSFFLQQLEFLERPKCNRVF